MPQHTHTHTHTHHTYPMLLLLIDGLCGLPVCVCVCAPEGEEEEVWGSFVVVVGEATHLPNTVKESGCADTWSCVSVCVCV
jgi:hypothetical protein